MTLDFTLLDADGLPREEVRVSPGLHRRLIDAARQENLQPLMRIADYYADAEFKVPELKDLRTSLTAILTTIRDTDREAVHKLVEIVDRAISSRKDLHVLAD